MAAISNSSAVRVEETKEDQQISFSIEGLDYFDIKKLKQRSIEPEAGQ